MFFEGPDEPLGPVLEGPAEHLGPVLEGPAEPLGPVLEGPAEPLGPVLEGQAKSLEDDFFKPSTEPLPLFEVAVADSHSTRSSAEAAPTSWRRPGCRSERSGTARCTRMKTNTF